jgi:hypothetical protein
LISQKQEVHPKAKALMNIPLCRMTSMHMFVGWLERTHGVSLLMWQVGTWDARVHMDKDGKFELWAGLRSFSSPRHLGQCETVDLAFITLCAHCRSNYWWVLVHDWACNHTKFCCTKNLYCEIELQHGQRGKKTWE